MTFLLTDTYFLATGYMINCCGVLDTWYYDADVENEEVELHVWRPTTGDNFRLISTTKHTANKDNKQTVTPVNFPLVLPGDRLGWYSTADVIGYKTGGNDANAIYLPATSVNTAGDVTWVGTTVSQEWAIGARLGEPSNPVYTGQTTGTIEDSASVNDIVTITVSFTDTDYLDIISISLPTPNTYFDVSDNGDNTATIKVKSSLIPLSGKTETLTVTAEDLCGHKVSQDIVISIINTPPVLTGLVSSIDTLEDVIFERELTKFTCTDSSTLDVSVSASPAHNPSYFYAKPTGVANEYGLYARSQLDKTKGQFDYYTQRDYTLTVTCTDDVDITTATVIVNLIQNTPPVIDNIPADGLLEDVSALAPNGTIVFTVDFHDDNDDTVDVAFTCIPANCPFYVLDSGEVMVIDDITQYPESGYDIFIGVADQRNFGINRTLSVRITDRNIPPVFLNLDNTETIDEGTAAGTSVFTVLAKDDDGDPYTFSWSEPNGGTSYFDLNPTSGLISTSVLIDYEDLPITPPFLFKVLVSDGQDTSTATLTLSIVDKNENLSLSSSTYRMDVLEWTVVDTILPIPGFLIIDVDTRDTYICTIDCGITYDGYYHINPGCNKTFAALAVASLYKLDEGMPTTVTCLFTVEDEFGYTDTATLVINILYGNDFTPVFSTDIYDFTVDPIAPSNTPVGTVIATDSDAVTYMEFSYSLVFNGVEEQYFKIDGSTGEIKTLKSMSACKCDDETFFLTVLATDDGGRVGTSTVQITVTDTNIFTDRYKTFWEDERNPVWFSILMLLIAITTVVTIYVCLNHVFMTSCCNLQCLTSTRRFNWRSYNRRESSPPPSPTPRRRNNKTKLISVRKAPQSHHSWQNDAYFF
ncbi:cadherin-23-like [Ruditapes philippinarum]|uniref:cadherin-23-like n=1 Tax=Ruditapes philippinarum TaxID=129788 RepID=UPI00295B43FC|nr:cadherin-23-like [Ruditapes philippinarum]